MLIGGRTGVGSAVLDLSERYRLEEAYAYILAMGFVGLSIDLVFARITDCKSSRARRRGGRTNLSQGVCPPWANPGIELGTAPDRWRPAEEPGARIDPN